MSSNEPKGQLLAQVLHDFSTELHVKETVHNEDLQLLNKVRICLEHGFNHFKVTTNPKIFSNVEFFIGGNFSSSTYGTFDTVIKVNDPAENISKRMLLVIYDTLRNCSKDLKIMAQSVQLLGDRHSIAFNFNSLTNVRIFVIFAPPSPSLTEIYKKMRGNSVTWRYYKAESIKMKLRFMPEQSSTANYVASLLKHWFQAIIFPDGTIFGDIAPILEVVAVHAVIDLEGRCNQEPSVLRGFLKCIDYFIYAFRLRQQLVREEGKWRISRVSGSAKSKFVLNPYNPAMNLVEDISVKMLEIVQQAAYIFKARYAKICRAADEKMEDSLEITNELFDKMQVVLPVAPGINMRKAGCYVTLKYFGEGRRGAEYPSGDHAILVEMIYDRVREVSSVMLEMSRHIQGCYSPNASNSRYRLNKKITETVKSAVKTALPHMLINGNTRTEVKLEWFDSVFGVKYRDTDGLSIVVAIKWEAGTLPKFDDFGFY